MRRLLACVVVVLAILSDAGIAQDDHEVNAIAVQEDRAPVPDSQAYHEARSVVEEVYASEIAAAQTPELLTDVAQTMIDAATPSEKPASRYALLFVAADLAGRGGDLEVVLKSADEIRRQFVVEPAALLTELFRPAFPADLDADGQAHRIIPLARRIGHAIAIGRYDEAMTIARAAQDASRQVKSKAIRDEINQLVDYAHGTVQLDEVSPYHC